MFQHQAVWAFQYIRYNSILTNLNKLFCKWALLEIEKESKVVDAVSGNFFTTVCFCTHFYMFLHIFCSSYLSFHDFLKHVFAHFCAIFMNFCVFFSRFFSQVLCTNLCGNFLGSKFRKCFFHLWALFWSLKLHLNLISWQNESNRLGYFKLAKFEVI